MPKFPVLSGREVVKVFEELGFHQLRQRGSHVVLRRGAHGCVVPLHRHVKAGTLAGILRQAQVPADEFLQRLK